jgi:hypothetical protein
VRTLLVMPSLANSLCDRNPLRTRNRRNRNSQLWSFFGSGGGRIGHSGRWPSCSRAVGYTRVVSRQVKLAEENRSAKTERSTPRTRIRTLEPVNASERTLRKTPSLGIVEQQILPLQRSSCFRFKLRRNRRPITRCTVLQRNSPGTCVPVLVMATRWGMGRIVFQAEGRHSLALPLDRDDASLFRRRAPRGPAFAMRALDSAAWTRCPLLAEAVACDDVEFAIAVEVAHAEGISGSTSAHKFGVAAGRWRRIARTFHRPCRAEWQNHCSLSRPRREPASRPH